MQTGDVGTEVMDRARALIAGSPGLSSTDAMRHVLRDDPALLAVWHHGAAGSDALPAADEPTAADTDPGSLLLASIGAKVAAGMEWEAATAATFKAYPAIAAAYHAGRSIPRQRAAHRRERMRRLAPDEPLISGRTYCHKLGGSPGGGMFEVL